MDFFFEFCNSIALLMLIIIYISLLTVLLNDDNDLNWAPCLSPFIAIVTYVCYIVGCNLFSDETVSIGWIILNSIIFVCLIIGIFRRRKNSKVAIAFGIVALAMFGIVPILSRTCKRVNLSFPSIYIDEKTLYISLTLIIFVCMLASIMYITTRSISRLRESTYSLYSMSDEIKQKLLAIENFTEPYAEYLKEDLRKEVAVLMRDLKNELLIGSYYSKKSSKNNKQDLIYRELISLKNQLEFNKQNMPFGFDELISNIKHSLTTPLSQIQSNCELLKIGKDEDRNHIVDDIQEATKVCLSIIHSYVEATNLVSIPAFLDLKQGVRAYFNMLIGRLHSEMKLDVKDLPSLYDGYSSNFVYALLIPLLQNAVTASPKAGVINIKCIESSDTYIITVSNTCSSLPPTLKQLSTPGYSSKNNHDGVGLRTVRNLLSLARTGSLEFNILNNEVDAILKLNKRNKYE